MALLCEAGTVVQARCRALASFSSSEAFLPISLSALRLGGLVSRPLLTAIVPLIIQGTAGTFLLPALSTGICSAMEEEKAAAFMLALAPSSFLIDWVRRVCYTLSARL